MATDEILPVAGETVSTNFDTTAVGDVNDESDATFNQTLTDPAGPLVRHAIDAPADYVDTVNSITVTIRARKSTTGDDTYTIGGSITTSAGADVGTWSANQTLVNDTTWRDYTFTVTGFGNPTKATFDTYKITADATLTKNMAGDGTRVQISRMSADLDYEAAVSTISRTLGYVDRTPTLYTPTVTKVVVIARTLGYVDRTPTLYAPTLDQTTKYRTLGYVDRTPTLYEPTVALAAPPQTLSVTHHIADGSAAAQTFTTPSFTPEDNSILLVAASGYNDNVLASMSWEISDSETLTWTELTDLSGTVASGGGYFDLGWTAWYAVVTTGVSQTVTVDKFSGTQQANYGVQVMSITGLESPYFENLVENQNASAAVTVTRTAPDSPTVLIWFGGGDGVAATWDTPDTGYTLLASSGVEEVVSTSEYSDTSTATTVNQSWTSSGAEYNTVGMSLQLVESAAAGTRTLGYVDRTATLYAPTVTKIQRRTLGFIGGSSRVAEFSDAFTYSNGQLDDETGWTAAKTIEVLTNEVVATTEAAVQATAATALTGTLTNIYSELTVTNIAGTGANKSVNLEIRRLTNNTATNDRMAYFRYEHGNGDWVLKYRDASNAEQTVTTTAGSAPTAPYTMRLEAVGDTYTGYADDVQVVTGTISEAALPHTYAYTGFHTFQATNTTVDNFSAGALTDGGSALYTPTVTLVAAIARTLGYVDRTPTLWALTAKQSKVGAAALDGSATLTAAADRTAVGAVALDGSATFTAAADRTAVGAVALTGSATLTAAGGEPGAAALSGSAALTAAAQKDAKAAAALTGAATLTAAADRTAVGAVTLSGSATLTAAGGEPGAAALSGSATVTVAAQKDAKAAADLDGSATLTATGQTTGNPVGSGSLSASATLAAATQRTANSSGALAGAATLTAAAGRTTFGAAALSGSATITVAGGEPGAAAFTATATLTAAGLKDAKAAAGLAGSATLAAAGTRVGAAALSGTATATVAGLKDAKAAAGLAGSATLTATGQKNSDKNGAGFLSGTAALAATGSRTANGVVALSGAGTLTGAGTRTAYGAAAIAGSASLASTGNRIAYGSVSLAGSATVTAAGQTNVAGAADLSGSATLTAAGAKVGSAALAGSATVTAAGSVVRLGAADLDGSAVLSASGHKILYGSADLTATAVCTATGKRTVFATASLSGLATLAAAVFQFDTDPIIYWTGRRPLTHAEARLPLKTTVGRRPPVSSSG